MPIKKNLANIVTIIRILFSPFLLYFTFTGRKEFFLLTIILLFFTDILDGFLARTLKIQSDIGRKLDSYADWLYLSFFIVGFVFLYGSELRKYYLIVIVDIVLVLIPKLIQIIRFKKIYPSHLYLEQLGGWIVLIFTILLLRVGLTGSLFYIFSLYVLIVATEQIFVAFLIRNEEESNIHSAFELLKKRRFRVEL